jgi:small-conductance mechanosensitive channel
MISVDKLELFLSSGSKWLPGPIIFVVLLLALLASRRAIFRSLGQTMHRRRNLLEAVTAALSPALTVAIITASLAVALGFEPIPPNWRTVANAVLTGGVVLALVMLVDGLAAFWMRRAATRFPMLGESYGLIAGFIRGIVFGLGGLMFLESVGISVGPILATLGIGSLAIALALQETLKNTLSGLFLIVDSPLAVGDYVKLSSGQEGWLTQLGWRSSRFRMMNDNMVIVPNSQLVDSIFTNLRTRDGALSIQIDINIAGGSDLERVERVTNEIASEVMAAVDENGSRFAPSVYFQSLSASSIGLAVFLRIARSSDLERARHEFIKRLTERFAREDIKLA